MARISLNVQVQKQIITNTDKNGHKFISLWTREIGHKQNGDVWYGAGYSVTVWHIEPSDYDKPEDNPLYKASHVKVGDVINITASLRRQWVKAKNTEYININVYSGDTFNITANVDLPSKNKVNEPEF